MIIAYTRHRLSLKILGGVLNKEVKMTGLYSEDGQSATVSFLRARIQDCEARCQHALSDVPWVAYHSTSNRYARELWDLQQQLAAVLAAGGGS